MAENHELPLLRSARREAMIAITIWFLATAWSVGCCYLYGYQRNPQTLTYVLGFPDWIFWGLVCPWVGCTIVSSIFAMCFMTDEELGGEEAVDLAE